MLLSCKTRLNIIVCCLALSGAVIVTPMVSSKADAQTVNRFTIYMHSGPGLEFSVTDEIPKRTPLSPEGCQSGWCRVAYGGAYGWVQQKALTTGPTLAQPKPGERPVECTDFARTGWPDAGDLERVCVFAPNKPIELDKPAG